MEQRQPLDSSSLGKLQYTSPILGKNPSSTPLTPDLPLHTAPTSASPVSMEAHVLGAGSLKAPLMASVHLRNRRAGVRRCVTIAAVASLAVFTIMALSAWLAVVGLDYDVLMMEATDEAAVHGHSDLAIIPQVSGTRAKSHCLPAGGVYCPSGYRPFRRVSGRR